MPARIESVRDDFHATGILFGRIAQRQTKDNHFVISTNSELEIWTRFDAGFIIADDPAIKT